MNQQKNLTSEQIRHTEMCRREALEQFRMANIRMDKRGGNRPVGMNDLVEIVVPGFSEDQFGNPVAYDEDGTLIRPLWALDNGFVPVLGVPMRLWVAYPRSRTFARNKYAVAIPFDIVYFKAQGLGLWNHKLSDRCEFRSAVAVRETRTVMVSFEPNPRRKDEWHGGFVGGKHIVWKPHGNPYEGTDVQPGFPLEVQASESWDRVECLPAVQTRRVKADGTVEELDVNDRLVDVALKPGQIQCRMSGARIWALDALGVKRHTDEAVLDQRIAEMLATRGERLDPATDQFCLAAKAAGSSVDYRLGAGVNAREVGIKNAASILRPKAPKVGHVAVLHPETGAKICDVRIEDVLGGDLSVYSSKDEVMTRFKQLKRYRRKSYTEHHEDDTVVGAVKGVFKRFSVHLEVDNKIRAQVGEDATRSLLERLIPEGTIRFKPARMTAELTLSAYKALGIEDDADVDAVFARFRELYFTKKGKVEREDPAVLALYTARGYSKRPNDNKGFNDRRALLRTAGEHLLADRFQEALTPPKPVAPEPKTESDDEIDFDAEAEALAEELKGSDDEE